MATLRNAPFQRSGQMSARMVFAVNAERRVSVGRRWTRQKFFDGRFLCLRSSQVQNARAFPCLYARGAPAIANAKGIADPLHTLARRIAQRHRLICFDEFHVSDIADAMLLYRLFGSLFRQGVQFIMTSNDAPDALYPDGLHRSRFLPAIALFNEKLDVLNVDAGIDYRQRALDWMPAYYIPIDASTDAALHDAFETLATAPDNPPVLTIEAREIRARRCAGDVIWFDFDVLCGDGRSQNDYLEIANCFHVLILSNVPRLTPRLADAARRFTWLIDILYDHHVRFLMSAAAPMTELYREGPYAHEFARTVSRLTEMQSKAYREAAHR